MEEAPVLLLDDDEAADELPEGEEAEDEPLG